LTLRHAVPDDDHWATYGPGAVGVGWDLPLLALARELAGSPLQRGFEATPEARVLMQRSATAWGAAHAAAGTEPATAEEAAAHTSAAYAPEPDGASA